MQWTPERLPVAGTPCPRCRSRAVSACPYCSHTAWAFGVRRPFPLALRGGFLGVVGIRGSAGQSALSRTRVCTPCARHPSDVLPPPVPVQGCAGHSANAVSPAPRPASQSVLRRRLCRRTSVGLGWSLLGFQCIRQTPLHVAVSFPSAPRGTCCHFVLSLYW